MRLFVIVRFDEYSYYKDSTRLAALITLLTIPHSVYALFVSELRSKIVTEIIFFYA